jgi:integrase
MNNAEMTLTKAWETLVLPQIDPIAESTLRQYRDDLRLWERLMQKPAVSKISRETVMRFREKLIQTPYQRGSKKGGKRSPNTVNRIMRELHVLVSPFWAPDRSYPGGLDLCPFFGWPRQLQCQLDFPAYFSVKDLDALYLNADAYPATAGCRSTPLNDPRLWRAAIVLAVNCGARTWDLFGLKWENINLESTDEYKFGWVVFRAKKTFKRHKVPLNQCSHAHLKDLQAKPIPSTEPDRVFPGVKRKGSAFYRAWRAIRTKAELGKVDFEDLRKTCVTMHNNLFPEVGNWITGHRKSDVTGFYDNPTERIREVVYRLEMPPAFKAGMLLLTGAA